MNNVTFVGVKEFRQNMASLTETAQRQRRAIIVMSRNKPLFEVRPFSDATDLESLVASVAEARAEAAAGRTYTHDEVLERLK